MIRALRYEILRRVSSTSLKPCDSQPSQKPIRVALLLNEAKLLASDGQLVHHETVFLEDSYHDWCWKDGKFYYYGHAMGVDETGDIVVVLEEANSRA